MTNPALTPLGVMVLALLREGDMHPYEMARLLRARRDDRIIPISNGTLYHTVSRLHGQGLLEEVGVDREGNRPERTTYAVTPAGTEAVREWVRRELGGTRRQTPFRVALAEAHNLERSEAIDLLTQRLALLRHELDALSEALHGANARDVHEQYLLEPLRHRLMLQADVDWLASLIHRMSSPDYAWGPDPEHLPVHRKARQND
ncbi:PadR family transcriptional regulator [Microbacterium sp. 22242]|uniref:PadR family transcriptional regulator n=1 Tax=Microbacterium sp. 22242 TaxID=3453896 RepID=UPI003F8478F5